MDEYKTSMERKYKGTIFFQRRKAIPLGRHGNRAMFATKIND